MSQREAATQWRLASRRPREKVNEVSSNLCSFLFPLQANISSEEDQRRGFQLECQDPLLVLLIRVTTNVNSTALKLSPQK